MIYRILKCMLLHREKHWYFPRSMKCRKCQLYYRQGPAHARWTRSVS